jgi:allophanate hydrolase
VELDPFLAAGRLLYDGPWLAERSAGLESFFEEHPDALHPVTREVLSGAALVSGAEVFRGLHELADLQHRTASVWNGIDTMLVPTAPTAPSIEEMLADPIAVNNALGRYTNFVNLLDLAAVAVPSEVTPTGVPVGVTLLAPTGCDELVLSIAATWAGDVDLPVTTAGHALVRPPGADGHGVIARDDRGAGEEVRVAVVGAHLEGEPLHGDLLRLGAHLSARARTADDYRLYALPNDGGGPDRPGLVRVPTGGRSVTTEVYWLPLESLGRLVASIPAPLGIGTVTLADGTSVLGFVCEHAGALEARDITIHGGWREYLAAMAAG